MIRMLKYKGILLCMLMSGFMLELHAANEQDAFIKIAQAFLFKSTYSLKYKTHLYTKDGKEIELDKGNSIVVKQGLSLFTQTEDIIYVKNPQGSLQINLKTKKMMYSEQPLSEEELKTLKDDMSAERSYQLLLKQVKSCDSFSVDNINGMKVYSTYKEDGIFTKAECWVNADNAIKEMRYFYADGDYVYQSITYEDYKVDNIDALVDFSSYITKDGTTITPSVKYKGYALYIK